MPDLREEEIIKPKGFKGFFQKLKDKIGGKSRKKQETDTGIKGIRSSPSLKPTTFEVDDYLLPVHSISLGDSDQLDREIFQQLQGQCVNTMTHMKMDEFIDQKDIPEYYRDSKKNRQQGTVRPFSGSSRINQRNIMERIIEASDESLPTSTDYEPEHTHQIPHNGAGKKLGPSKIGHRLPPIDIRKFATDETDFKSQRK